MSLAHVEADLGTPLHVRVEDPLYNKECPLHAADLAQRNSQIILAWVGGKLAEQLARLASELSRRLMRCVVPERLHREKHFGMENLSAAWQVKISHNAVGA